jgi:hypothetical protein
MSGVSQVTTTKKNTRSRVRKKLKYFRNLHSDRLIPDFHLMNETLPLNYNFKFVIDEISNINDKAQVMLFTCQ